MAELKWRVVQMLSERVLKSTFDNVGELHMQQVRQREVSSGDACLARRDLDVQRTVAEAFEQCTSLAALGQSSRVESVVTPQGVACTLFT